MFPVHGWLWICLGFITRAQTSNELILIFQDERINNFFSPYLPQSLWSIQWSWSSSIFKYDDIAHGSICWKIQFDRRKRTSDSFGFDIRVEKIQIVERSARKRNISKRGSDIKKTRTLFRSTQKPFLLHEHNLLHSNISQYVTVFIFRKRRFWDPKGNFYKRLQMNANPETQHKVLILGNQEVGKTAIVNSVSSFFHYPNLS